MTARARRAVATAVVGGTMLTAGVLMNGSNVQAEPRSLAGTWTVTVDPDGAQPPFVSTIAYGSAGEVVEATSRATASAGIGSWKRLGDGRFAIRFLKYRFTPGGTFEGTTEISEVTEVAPGGGSYTGRATSTVRNAAGAVVASFQSSSSGERWSG